MKGHALQGRYKQKDAYDIYYCIRNYPGGIGALAEACRPILGHPSGEQGYRYIAEKFDTVDGYRADLCPALRRRIPDSRAIAPRTSGNKMLSVRSMNGCVRLD